MSRTKREFVEEYLLRFIRAGGDLSRSDVAINTAVKNWEHLEKYVAHDKTSDKVVLG